MAVFLIVEDAGTSGMLLVYPHNYNQSNHPHSSTQPTLNTLINRIDSDGRFEINITLSATDA